jgi:hypothetical protein
MDERLALEPLIEKLKRLHQEISAESCGTEGWRKLAEKLGVAYETLIRWVHHGRKPLSVWEADQVARSLGCHPSEIWGRNWDPPLT